MRITILSHYYPPEVNAPASRMHDLARLWSAEGHAVTVVTCAPNHPRGEVYPGYRNRFFQRETIDGVVVIRLWTAIAANEGFLRRLIGYLSYPVSVLLNLWRLPSRDVVVATSPQFFSGLSGAMLRRRDVPWILEIRDLWPESIVSVGAMRPGPAIRLLEAIERWAYRSADAIVSVTDSFVGHFRTRAPKTPVEVIKNGVDLSLFAPIAEQRTAVPGLEGIAGKFIAGYVGTHGMAHALDTVVDAAAILRDRADIAFLLVGEGAERQQLEARARNLGLTNIVFLGQQPKSAMPAIWSSIDVSIVHLKRVDTFRSVLPSKMFEAMAMGLPIVLGVEGEAADLLEEAGAGLAFTPEDPEALAEAISELAVDRAGCAALGQSGQAFVTEHFDRRRQALRYLEIIQRVVDAKRAR